MKSLQELYADTNTPPVESKMNKQIHDLYASTNGEDKKDIASFKYKMRLPRELFAFRTDSNK